MTLVSAQRTTKAWEGSCRKALALKNRQEYRGCIARMNPGARYEMRQHPLARHPAYKYLCI
jgi:hypothetical protein